MSVSTTISRNGCASAPTTTSGCSGTEYAPSQQSQFDVMFQEVQDRMYKLFERYSQLKERNRYMSSSRQSARDDTEHESRVSTAKSTSKNISTVITVTQEETVEDDTGSETSCSCSLRSEGTRDTEDEPRNIAASVASKPTRISNEPCATVPRAISPVPQPECSEPFPSQPPRKPNKSTVKSAPPPLLSRKLRHVETLKPKSGKNEIKDRTENSDGCKIESNQKEECLPSAKADKVPNEPVVIPLAKEAVKKLRPQSNVPSSVCPQCEDRTCKQHKLPRPSVGYQLNFPPSTCPQTKPTEKCGGCSYSAQSSGRNFAGQNVMQISRLRSACMCVYQELPDVQQMGQGDGQVCQVANQEGVSFAECETVPLQDAFYNRKKVFVMRSEDRQEQIQSKHDGRMHPSWWSGPPTTDQPVNQEPGWHQRFTSRSGSTNYRQEQRPRSQEDEGESNGCFIDQQKNVPLIYRDNEISLKRARMETSRRVKQLEPKKIDRAKVLENKRVRRQKMMAYSRLHFIRLSGTETIVSARGNAAGEDGFRTTNCILVVKPKTEEKVGNVKDTTQIDEQLLKMMGELDATEERTTVIVRSVERVLKPFKEQSDEAYLYDTSKRSKLMERFNPQFLLGKSLVGCVKSVGEKSALGKTLMLVGQCELELGNEQLRFIGRVADDFLHPMRKFLRQDLATAQKEKKELLNRRLELDSAKTRLKRTKNDKQFATMEAAVRLTQVEFDRQTEITKIILKKSDKSKKEHTKALAELISAQTDHYRDTMAVLTRHKTLLDEYLTTLNTPAATPRTTSIGLGDTAPDAAGTLGDDVIIIATVGYDYKGKRKSELSVKMNEIVQVFEENPDRGEDPDQWIYVERGNGKRGYVPIDILRPVDSPSTDGSGDEGCPYAP